MNRISRDALVGAVRKVRALDLAQKEQFADELFQAQPHVFGAFLVQQKLGVSLEKMEFLLDILFVYFQAMKESTLNWPLITEDEQERLMGRLVATVRFGEDLADSLSDLATQRYIENYPEKNLLAFVQNEVANWLTRVAPEGSDKFVIMAAMNLVDCIAFVPFSGQTNAEGTNATQRARARARRRGKSAPTDMTFMTPSLASQDYSQSE